MTREQVIMIEYLMEYAKITDYFNLTTKEFNELDKEVSSALEKQIPSKLTHEAAVMVCGTCPNCKNVIKERNQDFEYLYCHFCGQSLE